MHRDLAKTRMLHRIGLDSHLWKFYRSRRRFLRVEVIRENSANIAAQAIVSNLTYGKKKGSRCCRSLPVTASNNLLTRRAGSSQLTLLPTPPIQIAWDLKVTAQPDFDSVTVLQRVVSGSYGSQSTGYSGKRRRTLPLSMVGG